MPRDNNTIPRERTQHPLNQPQDLLPRRGPGEVKPTVDLAAGAVGGGGLERRERYVDVDLEVLVAGGAAEHDDGLARGVVAQHLALDVVGRLVDEAGAGEAEGRCTQRTRVDVHGQQGQAVQAGEEFRGDALCYVAEGWGPEGACGHEGGSECGNGGLHCFWSVFTPRVGLVLAFVGLWEEDWHSLQLHIVSISDNGKVDEGHIRRP